MRRFGFVGTSGLLIVSMTWTLVAMTGGCQTVLGIVDLPIGEGGAPAGGAGGTGTESSSSNTSTSGTAGMANGGMGGGSANSSSGMGMSSSSSSSSSGMPQCRNCLEPQRRTLLQGAGNEIIRDIAVDGDGNIIIVGSITTDMSGAAFDPPCSGTNCALVSAGGDDIFIAKLDAMGVPIWTLVAGDTGGSQAATSVVIDSTGDIFVGGTFKNSIEFVAGSPLNNFSSNTDGFIARIDKDGNAIWSKQIAGSSTTTNEIIVALAVDKATGDFLAVGDFSGALTLGSDVFTAMGGTDVFLSRFDSTGNPKWSKQFGAANNQNGIDLAVDASGNAVVLGQCDGTINFGPGAKSCNLKSSVFVVKFDPSGTFGWSNIFGNDIETTEGKSIAVDNSGSAFITGTFTAKTDFSTPGTMPLDPTGNLIVDTYVAKLDASGNGLWSRKFGAAKTEIPTSIAVSGNNVFVTGSMRGTVQFDGGTLMSADTSTDDIFLIGYDSSGVEQCGINIGGTVAEDGMALDIGANGEVILAARYNATIPIVCTDNATHVGSADAMIVTIKP